MSRLGLQFKIIIIFNKFGKVNIFKIIQLIAIEIYDHITSLKIMKTTLCIQGTLIHSTLNFTVHTNLNFYTSSLQLLYSQRLRLYLSYYQYESESSFSFLLATNLCKLQLCRRNPACLSYLTPLYRVSSNNYYGIKLPQMVFQVKINKKCSIKHSSPGNETKILPKYAIIKV